MKCVWSRRMLKIDSIINVSYMNSFVEKEAENIIVAVFQSSYLLT